MTVYLFYHPDAEKPVHARRLRKGTEETRVIHKRCCGLRQTGLGSSITNELPGPARNQAITSSFSSGSVVQVA